MITRLAFGRGLLYRTCLVRHTETYATKKVTPKRAFKPEAGSALTKEKSKRASKPEAGSSTGSDSDNDDDTLSNRITASTPLTFKQWKVYGGKIYEKRLKYLVKAKNVAKAMETLQLMKDRKVNISLLAYNMLISEHTRTGDIKKAFKLFNELKKRSLLPDEYTYTSLFNGCGVAGPTSLDIFDKITAEMERREIIPNTVTCNAMIKALVMCVEPVRAFEVYESMMSTYTPPDLHTYSSLLMASMIKTNDNGMELAMDVWNELRASELPPDVHCYNMLIQCLRDCSYPESWIAELDRSDDSDEFSRQRYFQGYIVLEFTEDFVLRLYVSKDGIRRVSLAGVENILKAMEKDSVKPDIKTFHFLTSLVSRNTYKYILPLVEKHQVSVDVSFVNRLMAAEGFQKSMELLKLIDTSGLTPNVYTYQTMAGSCRNGTQVLKLLSIIRENGHTPSDVVWETLITVLAKSQNYDSLLQLMKKMKFMRCRPNENIMSTLSDVAVVCSRKGSSDSKNFLDYYKSWKKDVRIQ